MRKLITIVLIIILSTSLWARGSQEENGGASLNVMIKDSAKLPKEEGTITENRWTQLIQEQTLAEGISVTFKPRGGSAVAHTLMMATGSAPDIAFTHNQLLFSKFASDGGITDLGPYLDEYGPNIKKIIDSEFLSRGAINGIQYAIPSKRDNAGKQGISLIRKDWLDALGLDVPTNRAELEAVLRAFKEQDPGNIGSDNVVPWGVFPPDPGTVFDPDFWLFDVMYSFLDHDLEKNTTIAWAHRDGFKDFFRWMHDLYQDGLIDREFATLSEEEKKRKLLNGQVGFLHWEWNRIYGQSSNNPFLILDQNGSEIEFIPIEVFQNDEGDYRKVEQNPVAMYLFVPKTSKNPAAAVAYMNWLLSEEAQDWMNYGIEGEHYEMIDGQPNVIDLNYNISTFIHFMSNIRLLGPYPNDPEALQHFNNQSLVSDFNGMAALAEVLSYNHRFQPPLFKTELTMMMKYGSGLIKICEKYWVKTITEDDFENNFNEFIEKLEDRNINLIEEERQNYYRNQN